MAEEVRQVIVNVPCVGCGYNVRMQRSDGVCPECRHAVGRTLAETAAGWGPGHVRHLGRCALWAAITTLAAPAMFLGLIGCSFLLENAHAPIYYERFMILGFLLAWQGVFVINVIAGCLFTRPARGTRRGPVEWLICLGGLLFLGTLVVPLIWVTIISAMGYPYLDHDMEQLMEVVMLLTPLCMLGLPVYAIFVGERLAAIYRRAGMAGRAGFGRWSLRLFAAGVLPLAGLIAFGLLADLLHLRFEQYDAILSILVPAIGLGGAGIMLLGMLGSIIALFLFARRMGEFARTMTQDAPLTAPLEMGVAQPPAT